ncbi:hypothetical protein HPB47_018911, partial [Ixodes persulcatus]
ASAIPSHDSEVMEVVVEGEEIFPEDFDSEEWTQILLKQRALALKSVVNTENPNTAPETVSLIPRKSRPLRRAPPMERLPETDIKIVLRPREGLDLNTQDQVRIHQNSNCIMISTPDHMRVRKFASIKSLILNKKQYEISTHVSTPANTAMGIIFKIPEEDTTEEITRNVVDFNPDLPIPSVKRLGSTDAAEILFNGYKVPFWIRYGYTTYRYTPFRTRPKLAHNADSGVTDRTCARTQRPDVSYAASPTPVKGTNASQSASCAEEPTSQGPQQAPTSAARERERKHPAEPLKPTRMARPAGTQPFQDRDLDKKKSPNKCQSRHERSQSTMNPIQAPAQSQPQGVGHPPDDITENCR